jgi:hypothetical protein
MDMRIASGGVQHETNTFAHTPTTLQDFERDSRCGPEFTGGDAIFELFRDTGTIHGGYIEGKWPARRPEQTSRLAIPSTEPNNQRG